MVSKLKGWYSVFSLLLALTGAVHAAPNQLWVEAQLADTRPYVQQPLIYLILVSSSRSVEHLEDTPPSLPGIALQRLDKADYTHAAQGQNFYVTAFRYVLIPQTIGKLTLPAPRVTVVQRGETIKLTGQALELDIRPPAVTPWLPLYNLKLKHDLKRGKVAARVGEPLTLTLTWEALGAGGDNLPSFAELLQNEDFKIYPERPETTRSIVRLGNILVLSGQRTETYTLIPRRDGRLHIPAFRQSWWDTAKQKAMTVEWKGFEIAVGRTEAQTLEAEAEIRPPVEVNDTAWYVWASFTSIGLFAFGWWLGAGHPGTSRIKRFLVRYQGILAWKHTLLTRFGQSVQQRLAAYLPQRQWQRLQQNLRRAWEKYLPRRLKLFGLLREPLRGHTAAECRAALQAFGPYLNLSFHATLPQIAAALCETYPRLHEARVRGLFNDVDAAIYAPHAVFDVDSWQAEFAVVFRFLPFYADRREIAPGLPVLNP